MKSEDLTKRIIGCAFEVANTLGYGFLESVYENSMVVALNEAGIKVIQQKPMDVYFHKVEVGHFVADLLVENEIVVELKAVKEIAPEHKAQLINYLKASGKEVGLLINFGRPKIEYKRLYWYETEEE
jgi:GxxExxY protein